MKRRRALSDLAAVAILAVVMASASGDASAQPRHPIPRVGILNPGTSESFKPAWDVFREAMTALGYVEAKTVVYEYRSAEGQFERLPELAAGLVNVPVKVMVVANTPGNLAAKKATTAIPIVMVAVGDPVRVRLVSNLCRPGGNLTGFTNLTGQLTTKRLQLIKELVPGAMRIGLIGNPGDMNALVQIQDAEAAARELKVQLRVFTVREASELDAVFEAARAWRAHALLRLADPLASAVRARTIELAARNRLPIIYFSRADIEAGGLIAYGVDLLDAYRRAAGYVDRILKGARPGELPVQQPTKFDLAVNLKTAGALGIKIPKAILAQADQVIE